MSDGYYEDADAVMAIEERETELGYYSDAAQRDRAEAEERAQCDLCGVWLAEHGTDCP
jgi:hypothetical protein